MSQKDKVEQHHYNYMIHRKHMKFHAMEARNKKNPPHVRVMHIGLQTLAGHATRDSKDARETWKVHSERTPRTDLADLRSNDSVDNYGKAYLSLIMNGHIKQMKE